MLLHNQQSQGVSVQGNGHIECSNGQKCAVYVDDENKEYATAELIPLNDYVKENGGSFTRSYCLDRKAV